jgi:hypothetical protein
VTSPPGPPGPPALPAPPAPPVPPAALGDRGAAALLATGVGLCLAALLCTVVPAATGLAVAGLRARSAADATALAALAASPLAGPVRGPAVGVDGARAAADAVARANGAVLVGLDLGGWPVTAAATVSVHAAGGLGSLVPPVTATSAARLDPP